MPGFWGNPKSMPPNVLLAHSPLKIVLICKKINGLEWIRNTFLLNFLKGWNVYYDFKIRPRPWECKLHVNVSNAYE